MQWLCQQCHNPVPRMLKVKEALTPGKRRGFRHNSWSGSRVWNSSSDHNLSALKGRKLPNLTCQIYLNANDNPRSFNSTDPHIKPPTNKLFASLSHSLSSTFKKTPGVSNAKLPHILFGGNVGFSGPNSAHQHAQVSASLSQVAVEAYVSVSGQSLNGYCKTDRLGWL